MSTFEEYNLIVSGLPPAANTIMHLLWEEPLSPRASSRLLDLARMMVHGSGAQWEKVRRALILLARLGKLSPRMLGPVIGSMEAELAAEVAAGGAAAGGAGGGGAGAGAAPGAGAAAGGVSLGLVLAGLAAVLAVAVAYRSIGSEYAKTIELPKDGQPCGMDTKGGVDMATKMRSTWARGIGQKTALQRAIDKAASLCNDDAAKCGGGKCAEGNCKPTVSIQEFEIKNRVLWTTVNVHFVCPCGCLSD